MTWMMRRIFIVAALTLLWGGSGGAAEFDPGTLNPKAPPETKQFGQLAGRWEISDETKQDDGSWEAGTVKHQWNWYYILDGFAVQDDWISPAPGVSLPEGRSMRQYGTNLRIYNPEKERWDLVWLVNTGMKIEPWSATYQDGRILMTTDVKRPTKNNPDGYHQRITFFDIKPDTFEWKLEFSGDGETWAEVYRIHGRRMD